jgi:hypothetical protein
MDLLFFFLDALHNLESDSRSSRLSTRIDELGQEYKQMLKIERNMQQIGKNIDYAISKFQEVDAKCAQALKASSYNYRSKVGLLTNEEKYGGIAGTALDWGKAAWKKYNEINDDIISSEKKAWNKAKLTLSTLGNEAGAFIKKNWVYISNAIDIACDVLTVIIAAVSFVACPPLAIAAIAFAVSDGIQSVTKIINYHRTGKEGNGFNPLERVLEYGAEKAGIPKGDADVAYSVGDVVVSIESPVTDFVNGVRVYKELKSAKEVVALKDVAYAEKAEKYADMGKELTNRQLLQQRHTMNKLIGVVAAKKNTYRKAMVTLGKHTLIYVGTCSAGPKGVANSELRYKWGYAKEAPSIKDVLLTQTDTLDDTLTGNIK